MIMDVEVNELSEGDYLLRPLRVVRVVPIDYNMVRVEVEGGESILMSKNRTVTVSTNGSAEHGRGEVL